MKIAYVYGAFVSRWVKGGVENRICEISKRLVERGYEVHWSGFARASGDCIVMGDGDNTYDFMDIPGNFLQKLGKCSIYLRDRTSSPERWTFEQGNSRGKIFSTFAFMCYWNWRGRNECENADK